MTQFWVELLNLLKQVPGIIWVAIAAPLIAFVGVWLTNRNSRTQHLASLKHDATMRDRERNMALRRDTYLPVIEAISNSRSLLTKLLDLDTSNKRFSAEASKYSAVIAKLQVVGANGTVQSVTAFSNAFGSTYMELILKRSSLVLRKSQIAIQQEFYDKYYADVAEMLELMKRYNLNNETDEPKWEAINKQIDYSKSQRDKFTSEVARLTLVQNQEYAEFSKTCFYKSLEISRLIPPAIFAMRKELDLALDEKAYMEDFELSLKTGEEAFSKFMENIKNLDS